jgi:carbon storage regulator
MLVMSRKKDESIVIGDEVVITVVEIRGDRMRLGIDAPREVPVHRREVYEALGAWRDGPADSDYNVGPAERAPKAF